MSKNYVICVDTNCDLPLEYFKAHALEMVPLRFTLRGETYDSDCGQSMDPREFYAALRAGEDSKTMQVSPDQALQCFARLADEGNDILCIAFSSGLSGTYNSFAMAAQELRDTHPDCKAIVIDSLCASLGQGLLIDYAVKMKEAGRPIEEVAEWVEAHKLQICHYFTVDDLKHLWRGGRVSKTTAVVGTMLGIKPLMHVDDEGKLIPHGKVRGRRQSLLALIDSMQQKAQGFENKTVMISHGDCLEDAEFVAKEVKRRFAPDEILINFVGPSVGAHSGPGTLALFFMGSSRTEG